MADDVKLTLSGDEALVLFDWLARVNDGEVQVSLLPPEQRVLWGIESMLESVLVEPFSPNYAGLLEAARSRLGDLDE